MIDYSIFKSKRFISAVATIIVMVLVAVVPQLKPLESTVVDTLTQIALTLVKVIV